MLFELLPSQQDTLLLLIFLITTVQTRLFFKHPARCPDLNVLLSELAARVAAQYYWRNVPCLKEVDCETLAMRNKMIKKGLHAVTVVRNWSNSLLWGPFLTAVTCTEPYSSPHPDFPLCKCILEIHWVPFVSFRRTLLISYVKKCQYLTQSSHFL